MWKKGAAKKLVQKHDACEDLPEKFFLLTARVP